MSKSTHYYGGNQTRNSVCSNPAAYANDNSGLFGVKEFRKFGYASEATRDAVAEREMTKGWTRKGNPICTTCHIQKSRSGSCGC